MHWALWNKTPIIKHHIIISHLRIVWENTIQTVIRLNFKHQVSNHK